MAYADPEKQREASRKAWAAYPREKKLEKQAKHREARRQRYAEDPTYRAAQKKDARESYYRRAATPEGREAIRAAASGYVERARQTPAGWVKLRLDTLRQRAKKEGLEFALGPEDLATPEICPYIGVPLMYATSKGPRAPNLASVDRIDAKKGYVPGNVVVCSFRANRLKQNATCAEFERLLAGMRAVGAP